jgi:hypothetical protein
MKGLPLNLDMARAWHEGRKTVTRRLMKQPEPHHWEAIKSHRLHHAMLETSDGWQCKFWRTIEANKELGGVLWAKPRYQPGEVVYIQEPWRVGAWDAFTSRVAIDYQCDGYCRKEWVAVSRDIFDVLVSESINDAEKIYGKKPFYKWEPGQSPCRWRSPVAMPEKLSRSKARIVDVRVERVQEITEDEAVKEGFIEDVKMEYGYMTGPIDYTGRFAEERFEDYWETLYPGSWSKNDWVFVYGLERVEGEK